MKQFFYVNLTYFEYDYEKQYLNLVYLYCSNNCKKNFFLLRYTRVCLFFL